MLRKITSVLLVIGMISTILTACNNPSNGTGKSSSANDKINIEFFSEGWLAIPCGDAKDPFKKYLDEKYNINITFTTTKNFKQDIMLRASSNQMPDLMASYDDTTLRALYEEGLLYDDYNKILDKMPTIKKYHITDKAKAVLTVNNKLSLLPNKPDRPLFSWKVRKDWLVNLGIDPVKGLPKTDAELLDLARKLTFNDPDKNGKNDTYGFTSAGGNQGIGEIINLIGMYGQPSWYVKDNKVNHPILDGSYKKLLDFLKTANGEKIIDPDWLTVDWNARKAPLFGGMFGICYYPGVLIGEEVTWGAEEKSEIGKWINLPLPSMDENGNGRLPPEERWTVLRAISKEAGKDEEKLSRICKLLDNSSWPNEDYYKIRWGDKLDNSSVVDLDGNNKFVGDNNEPRYRSAAGSPGGCDWGLFIATNYDMVCNINVPVPGPAVQEIINLDKETLAMKRFRGDWLYLNLPAKIEQQARDYQNEFAVKYILGSETDYSKFVEEWKSRGGQQLIEEASKQFKKIGLIK